MLGAEIRRVRQDNGLTLKQLAERVDVTASYLSQLERDIVEPSLSVLRKIANALGVPVYIFLANEDKQHVLVKRDKRKKLKLPNASVTYEVISPMTYNLKEDVKMVSLYYEQEPNTWLSDDFLMHNAQELIYIIEGRLDIFLGEEKYTLENGDSIFIKENVPHKMFNSGDEIVRGISVICPPIY